MGSPVRRQPHGIRVEQITITISRDEMRRLRREAMSKQVSVSRHVVDVLRRHWSQEAHGTPLAEPAEIAV